MIDDVHKQIVDMVILNNSNVRCYRDKIINRRSEFMATKEKDVMRMHKFSSQLSSNLKEKREEQKQELQEKQKKVRILTHFL